MNQLTASERKLVTLSQIVLPSRRAYPIPDARPARAALARAAEFATPQQHAAIRRNVHHLYTHIRMKECL